MAEASAIAVSGPGWLRSKNFDLTFVRGIAVLALVSGSVVVVNPDLFSLVLFADIWLLGYHHVIATFTRLAFDRNSLRQNRFLIFYLPPVVFAVTFMLGWAVGVWVIASIYLYWQWFHYTRQSWGISQIYRAKSGGLVDEGPVFSKLCFYLLPIWGILYRSWQAPEKFLFLELHVIPTPELLVDIAGILAFLSVAAWGYNRFRAWRAGRLPVAHTYYMISHFVIFLVSYRLIEDITYGWLVINIWHNAQYILFVWLFNTNRYKSGIDENALFLSTISQPENKFRYFTVCVGITVIVYYLLSFSESLNIAAQLPILVIVYQAINFHHYIVDSLIWKVRKKPLRQTMGLKEA
jgi:hypothetical protein